MKILNTLSSKKYFKWVVLFFIGSIILMENKWFGQQYFKSITGGLKMIDMNLYNSSSEITNYLTTIGTEGREAYQTLLYLDFLMIVSFFLFLSTNINRLLIKTKLTNKYTWLLLFPLMRSVFDILETSAMLINTSIFPKVTKLTITIAELSTPIKWTFLLLTIAGFLSLLAINYMNKFKLHINKSYNGSSK